LELEGLMPLRWSLPTILLHWLTALVIMVLIAGGLTMVGLPADSDKRHLIATVHTLGGVGLGIVTIVRLLLRWRQPAPAPLPMSPAHGRLTRVVHALTYVAVLAMCLSGFVTAKRSTWHEYISGDTKALPDFEGVFTRQAHEAILPVLVLVVVIHIAGVVLHQIRAGGALSRMIPWRR
jgi:cytochrome b561